MVHCTKVGASSTIRTLAARIASSIATTIIRGEGDLDRLINGLNSSDVRCFTHKEFKAEDIPILKAYVRRYVEQELSA